MGGGLKDRGARSGDGADGEQVLLSRRRSRCMPGIAAG